MYIFKLPPFGGVLGKLRLLDRVISGVWYIGEVGGGTPWGGGGGGISIKWALGFRSSAT